MPAGSISDSSAVCLAAPLHRRLCRGRDALFADVALVGDFDHGLLARRPDILSRFEALIGESLTLGHADAFDDGLVVELGEVTGDRARRYLLAEKSQAQGMDDAALIDAGHGVQTV